MKQVAIQVKEQFISELRALLSKYDASDCKAGIEAENWGEYCSERLEISVCIPSVYDKNGKCVREGTTFSLGQSFQA